MTAIVASGAAQGSGAEGTSRPGPWSFRHGASRLTGKPCLSCNWNVQINIPRARGGGTPSATRSTSAASPTATVTASATWPASRSGCPTSPTSVSTRSGSRPFYPSPQHDHGYDVADYRDVDPLFGTLADFDAMLDDGPRPGHQR